MGPLDRAVYTVTVTNSNSSNSNGTSTLELPITVHPAAPVLMEPLTDLIYATGAMVKLELTNAGGGMLNAISADTPGCALGTQLPDGLRLTLADSGDTCIISGTPSTVQMATDYVVTATNITGNSMAHGEHNGCLWRRYFCAIGIADADGRHYCDGGLGNHANLANL